VVKDSGDDPDVTDGIKVFSDVSWSDEGEVIIEAGEGVGRVSKPGLAVEVGRAAINPTPRSMIERDLTELLPPERGFHVILSIPGGEELAAKTWNPRLGIEGGLSIIGTTGIVEPKSTEAYTATIEAAIGVAAEASGVAAKASASSTDPLYLVPGYVGERAVSERFQPPAETIVRIGDHVGFALEACAERAVRKIVLAGHVGKITKVAAGLFDTHSRAGDARLETLAACAAAEGAGPQLVEQLLDLKLAEAAVEPLEAVGLSGAFRRVADRAAARCTAFIDGRCEVSVIVLDLRGRLLSDSG
jgi:cobalt-precorrin-5B (C1)-methyltransferase